MCTVLLAVPGPFQALSQTLLLMQHLQRAAMGAQEGAEPSLGCCSQDALGFNIQHFPLSFLTRETASNGNIPLSLLLSFNILLTSP